MRDAAGVARAGAVRAARALLSPTGLRGASVELAWTTAHFAFYPLGLLREKVHHPGDHYSLRELAPWQRGLVIGDVATAGTPILLVHGFVDNRSIFTLLRRSLRRRGFGRVVTMNYPVFTHDIPGAAARLGRQVEQLCGETGYERIHVIGHSLGGLIARYYVQRLGGDARVHTLATLGTPHQGTHLARLLNTSVVRQLRPGSPLLRELAAPSPGCQTRVVAIWSDLDQLVFPQRFA
ncbi:MAG: alpha/beta fold hydrolase, partial [Frankia sp.]|nr:alpha/beta fold hydrolase [Frankia sp.]